MGEPQTHKYLPTLSVESEYNYGQRTFEPPTPRVARPSAVSPELRRTLAQAWEEAQQSFLAKTNKPLASLDPKRKDGFLDAWQRKFDDDNSEKAKKSAEMKSVLYQVVSGVELVGAFAAQAACAVFPPANMCFNAIDILMNAPKKIDNVYDCLKVLFEEVAQFLVKFRILDRIDQKFGLDEDLLENTNRLLIVFIEICAMAVPLVGGNKFWLVAAKATFLNNDSGVGGAIEKFRRLTESHSNLTELVTLEEVLKSKEKSDQILDTLGESNVMLRSLFSANKDEKTLRVNKERLHKIEDLLFSNEERHIDVRSQKLMPSLFLLQGTMDALEANPTFQKWYKADEHSTKLLLLNGEQGTGKTALLQALADKFNLARNELIQPGPSIYVASYSFNADHGRQIGKAGGTSKSSIPYALRNLALQVAEQSTRYSEFLDNILRTKKELKIEQSITKLWDSLGFLNFSAPKGSTMYLLFDGLEHENEDSVTELQNIFLATKKSDNSLRDIQHATSNATLNLRIVASGDRKSLESRERSVSMIKMSEFNCHLIKTYTEDQLDACACFADDDPQTMDYRDNVINTLPEKANGNFNIVRQKIALIHEAWKNDASTEELTRILEEDTSLAVSEEGKKTLNQLGKSLTAQHIEQLNLLLLCIFYTMNGNLWLISELEAFLYLEFPRRSLEPLSKKVWERFKNVFEPYYNCVRIEERVRSALEEMSEASPTNAQKDKSLITMSINISNASEEVVRKFIWELNEQVMAGKFDFSTTDSCSTTGKIYVNKLEAHKTFVRWYLKLLNEPPQKETQTLIFSAKWMLPYHLQELRQMSDSVPLSDVQQIGQGLVNYFSDPFNIEQHLDFGHLSIVGPSHGKEGFETIQQWLEDPRAVRYLSLNEKRWIETVKKAPEGKFGYLRQMASGIARCWLNRSEGEASDCFRWIEWYLEEVANQITSPQTQDQIKEDVTKKDPHENIKENQARDDAKLPEGDPKTDAKEDPKDSQTTGDGEEKKKPFSERIEEAFKWANKTLAQEPNGHSYQRLGQACFYEEEYGLAVEYYKKARSFANSDWKSLRGLARAYRQLKADEKAADTASKQAFDTMTESIQQAQMLSRDNKLDEKDTLALVESLRELARWYIEDDRQQEAIPLYKQIVDEGHGDNKAKWDLLQLFSSSNLADEATSLLKTWAEDGGKDNQKLSSAILSSVKDDPLAWDLMEIIQYMNDHDPLSIMVQALKDAYATADRKTSVQMRSTLLFLQGLLVANDSTTSQNESALELWRRACALAKTVKNGNWATEECIARSARHITKTEFDLARAEWIREEIRSNEMVERLVRDFEVRVTDSLKISAAPETARKLLVHTYLAGFYVMVGDEEQARNLLRADMAEAIEILTDDDPDNDWQGWRDLMYPLLYAGDIVGVLTVFSLFDRKRSSCAKTDATSEDKQNAKLEEEQGISFTHNCDLCYKYPLASNNPGGIWWCRYCPRSDFCPDCFLKLRRGEIKRKYCSPDHDFIHLYHTEYSDDEIAPDKVRIEWELEKDSLVEGNFTRKGGRIVDVKEWLEILRKQWDLPEPSTRTLAQK